MRKTLITDAIAALFILLFMYAALTKLLEFQKFKVQLGQSPMLTYMAAKVAVMVPLTEIMIALLLAFQQTRQWGLYASFCLMSLFSAYIVAITQFSDYIPCSCGGILQKMSWNQHLVFNIVFIVLAATAILLSNTDTDKRQLANSLPSHPYQQ